MADRPRFWRVGTTVVLTSLPLLAGLGCTPETGTKTQPKTTDATPNSTQEQTVYTDFLSFYKARKENAGNFPLKGQGGIFVAIPKEIRGIENQVKLTTESQRNAAGQVLVAAQDGEVVATLQNGDDVLAFFTTNCDLPLSFRYFATPNSNPITIPINTSPDETTKLVPLERINNGQSCIAGIQVRTGNGIAAFWQFSDKATDKLIGPKAP
jgi:hypothetical protein